MRPPGKEEEEVDISDPQWGPFDDEDIGYLLRRIDFQKIIDFHIKDLKHKLVKSESLTKRLKDIVSGLQVELTISKLTCEQQQVQIDQLQKRMEGLDGERLERIESKIEELQEDEVKDGERLDVIETQLEELKEVSENENSFQVQQQQDINRGSFDGVKNNIIIKNLPMVSPNGGDGDTDNGGDGEDPKDMVASVKNIFKHLGLSSTVKFSAKRIINTAKAAKRGRNGRKRWPPIIKVAFCSENTKSELFPLLHKLKGSSFEAISIQNEWPSIYRHQIRDLEIKATKHRRSFPGSSTRIKIVDNCPTIMVRKSATCSFQPL